MQYLDILRADRLASHMLKYVENLLAPVDRMSKSGQIYPFRSRYAHVERVTEWALRICMEEGGGGKASADVGALAVASIFHDSGYHYAGEGHARHSVMVFNKYIAEHLSNASIHNGGRRLELYDSASMLNVCNYDYSDVDAFASVLQGAIHTAVASAASLNKIREIIATHSDKHIFDSSICFEAGILMDADLLDEAGAMAVLFDCYIEASSPDFDYYSTYERLSSRYSSGGEVEEAEAGRFHSAAGKRLHIEMRRYVGEFINGLKIELGK